MSISSDVRVADSSARRTVSLAPAEANSNGLLFRRHVKPPVSHAELEHSRFLEGEFWRGIPAYSEIDRETFLDYSWQARHSLTTTSRLRHAVGERVSPAFLDDVELGFHQAPMAMRLSPYIVSLIDWDDPYNCPLRIQFLPVARRLMTDHPRTHLDSLNEQEDAPVPGLIHRYFDKALFLPISTCPVYCRFCTRSYAVGSDTDEVKKLSFRVNPDRWQQAFAYIESRPELEDIVISGGDAYNLRADQLEEIGLTLLAIPNVRRIRIATKGLAIMPQKILSDQAWLDAVTTVDQYARKHQKDMVIHTHFNHPREITWITQQALAILHQRGITVRNQAVLQRGVNDTAETMTQLVRRLSYINVHPYYVYVCDMVRGIEDLRTSLATAIAIEKHVRGYTAGFNTPTFVCDLPGGGGKRCVHSYEYYNRETGIAVYVAPSVKPGPFLYFDPLHSLSETTRTRWADEQEQRLMIDEAVQMASAGHRS
ncbi:MAG: KamA family radical SAM protein [Pirellulales bacterium]|nr:KamA family radical SAM protein [Pirellulales bacterium]